MLLLSMSAGMVDEANDELYDRFIAFYDSCCREKIEQLAQNHPDEQRSLYVDYADLEAFDPDIAEDYLNHPEQMRTYAEQALLLVENSADVSLSETRVRLYNLPDMPVDPGTIRAQDNIIGGLVTVRGYIQEASDVTPTITQAAFKCQRCETLTRIPQIGDELQEPPECQGCARQGPFRINSDQSEFEDKQTLTVIPVPEAAPTTDGELEVVLEDDLAGAVAQGDRVEVAGVVEANQEGSKTAVTISLTGEAVSRVSPQETGLYSGSYLAVPENSITEDELEAFVRRSTAVLRTQTLDEFGTQSKIITPFLHLLGWNIYHPEVRFEYSDPEVDGGQADYALLGENESPVFIVEAKQEGENLDWHTGQLKKYMRVFQAQYGLLTNGERYLFFCANPEADESSEVEVLDCALSDLGNQRTILAAYGREAIVGERTSLEMLAEAAQGGEDKSGTRNLTAEEQVERVKRIKGIVDDLQGEDHGAPIKEVCRRAESEFGIPREETEYELDKLCQHSELYEHPPDHFRIL